MRSVISLLAAVGLSVFFSVSDAAAQADTPKGIETNSGPIIPFLEGTDVFSPLRKEVVFEADIFPHLVVYQNFSNVIDIREQARRGIDRMKQLSWVVTGTPAVRLRMFEEVSRPVRTPSYMPRGSVQMIFARGVKDVLGPAAAVDPSRRDEVSLWEGHLIVGHHSNGQDGCLYTDEVRSGEDCVRTVTPSTGAREINTKDGSFSTNYARVGVNYRKNYLDRDLWAIHEWGLRADVEQHFNMDPLIRELYGRTRFEFAATHANREVKPCRHRLEVSGAATVITGASDEVWPVAITGQLSCFPFDKGGWGFFVRYYGGQDYYNVGFLKNIQRVHVGATFNTGGFFRFHRPDP
jgi:hypothetical protein